MSLSQTPRILIIGGGYAGFYAAWHLERKLRKGEASITIVDPRPYMTYQPFLPEVLSGGVEPRHAVVSHRNHLKRTTLIRGEAARIDHASRQVVVVTRDGAERTVEYDELVVTAGVVTRKFPVAGIAESAIGLKYIEEAVAIRDRLMSNFDAASSMPRGPERSKLLTVTVVGGGFSGVEAFGEILAFATGRLKSYPEIDFDDLHFHLVEATSRILPEVSNGPGEWVVEHLRRRGGSVHLSTTVDSIENGHVMLSSGERFDSDLIIWATGSAANPVVARNTDLPVNARGLIPVLPDLRVELDGNPVAHAWAAGDAASVPDLAAKAEGARTVPNAQHAVRQGVQLAKNLAAALRGEEPRPYVHHSLGVVATLGLRHGIFQYKRIVIRGPIAWLMHRGYHVLAVPTWERKIRVLAVWVTELFFGRDMTSLEDVQNPRSNFVRGGELSVR